MKAIVRCAAVPLLAVPLGACGHEPTAPTEVDLFTLDASYVVTLNRAPTAGNTVTTCRSVTVELPADVTKWRWIPTSCDDPRLAPFGHDARQEVIFLLPTDRNLFQPLELHTITGDASRRRLTSRWRGLTCRNEIEPGSSICVMEAGTAVWARK